MFLYTLFTHLRVNRMHQYFFLCNLFFLSKIPNSGKKKLHEIIVYPSFFVCCRLTPLSDNYDIVYSITNHITCLRLTVDRNLPDTSSSFMAIVRRLKYKWKRYVVGRIIHYLLLFDKRGTNSGGDKYSLSDKRL